MIKTEHILEFDKIKETWKTFAAEQKVPETEIEKNRANECQKERLLPG